MGQEGIVRNRASWMWSSDQISEAERCAAERGWAIRADQFYQHTDNEQYWLLTCWGFEKVSYVDADWWVHTGSGIYTMSYCCGPETLLFNAQAVQELENRYNNA